MQLVVGRVGRPHGIRGELTVQVHTDDPDLRFAAGSVLATEPAERGPLTICSSRWHSGRLLVSFDGYADRTVAEDLRGTLLVMDSAEVGPTTDPDEFHDYELVGLEVLTVTGDPGGVVADVRHQGQNLLVVRPAAGHAGGGEILVPFVAAIVPEVDLKAGRLVIDPPPGLLDLGALG
jgi:16S rRNA processing protein RimM